MNMAVNLQVSYNVENSRLAEELFAFARTVFHAMILLVTNWTIKWQQ